MQLRMTPTAKRGKERLRKVLTKRQRGPHFADITYNPQVDKRHHLISKSESIAIIKRAQR
jgi:hypothetical protein